MKHYKHRNSDPVDVNILPCMLKVNRKQKHSWDFPGGSVVKTMPASAGDPGSIPDLGRSHMLRSSQAWVPQPLSLCVLEPGSCNYWARVPQSLKSKHLKPVLHDREAAAMKSPGITTDRITRSLQQQRSAHSNQDPAQPERNKIIKNQTLLVKLKFCFHPGAVFTSLFPEATSHMNAMCFQSILFCI